MRDDSVKGLVIGTILLVGVILGVMVGTAVVPPDCGRTQHEATTTCGD